MGLLEDLNTGKYNLILFVIIFLLFFHQYFSNRTKESMADLTEAQMADVISKYYLADVEAVRRLSKIATQLLDGGVTIPGNLKTTGNLNIGGSIVFQDQDIRMALPIILNFHKNGDENFFDRTFSINNKSFITILYHDDNSWNRLEWFYERMKKLGRDSKANVRHLNDFRTFTNITLTVPPGKIAKFFGWGSGFKKFTSGYYQETLTFPPHFFWAGWAEFDSDFPDNLNMADRNGM